MVTFCRLALCLAVSGCSLGAGVGHADGALYVANCSDSGDFGSLDSPATFHLRPNYFVATYATDPGKGVPHDHLSLRLQSGPERSENADAIFIQFTDVGYVGARVGTVQKITTDSAIRASLRLGQTCPRARTQMELNGTLSLAALGAFRPGVTPSQNIRLSVGDVVAGTFQFDIVDRRNLNLGHTGSIDGNPAVTGQLGGDFSFQLAPDRGL